MSEGPQVRLKTERLRGWLAGRAVAAVLARQSAGGDGFRALAGRSLVSASCKGKRIFLDFGPDAVLHNHLLMRGKWQRLDGQLLFAPPGLWLGLSTGSHTVCNFNGQVLELVSRERAGELMRELGPDPMDEPSDGGEILRRLAESPLPLGEALLAQSVVSGLGNVARAECLYRARIDLRRRARELTGPEGERLAGAMRDILWESYRQGGRWTHRVYARAGEPCGSCGSTVRVMRLSPSRRSLYFCPRCQR